MEQFNVNGKNNREELESKIEKLKQEFDRVQLIFDTPSENSGNAHIELEQAQNELDKIRGELNAAQIELSALDQ